MVHQAQASQDNNTTQLAHLAPMRPTEALAPELATARKAEFVARYQIDVLDETKVRYVLPAGTSRLTFLEQAEEVANVTDLYRHVVQPAQLELWARDPLFQKPLQIDRAFGIDCTVEGSQEKTRSEQREFLSSLGLSMVWVHDLAVAHVAVQMATEWRDAFRHENRSHTVRAEGGQLFCSLLGLTERCFFMHDLQYHAALRAGAYLPGTSLANS